MDRYCIRWTGRKYREISRKIGKNTEISVIFSAFFEILLRLLRASDPLAIYRRFIGPPPIFLDSTVFLEIDNRDRISFQPTDIRYFGEISQINSDISIHGRDYLKYVLKTIWTVLNLFLNLIITFSIIKFIIFMSEYVSLLFK